MRESSSFSILGVTVTVLPRRALGKAAVYTALVLLADTLVIGAASLVLSRNVASYFTLLMLLEAGVLLFTGGFRKPTIVIPGLAPTSQREWSLIMTGLFVLVLSFLLAYPLEWLSR